MARPTHESLTGSAFKPSDKVYIDTFNITGRTDFCVQTTHGQVMQMLHDMAAMPEPQARHMYGSAYRCMCQAAQDLDAIWDAQLRGEPDATEAWQNLCDDVVIVCALRRVLHGLPIHLLPDSCVRDAGNICRS